MSTAIARQRTLDKLSDDLDVLGLREILALPEIEDVFVNPDGRMCFKKRGSPPVVSNVTYDPADVLSMINAVAALNDQAATWDNPIVEAILPMGGYCRFEGLIPPIVAAPTIAIRTLPRTVRPLSDYVETGTITEAQCAAIRQAIAEPLNVVVVGATGAGKTTFLNACLNEIAELAPEDRIVSIEDVAELLIPSRNKVAMYTSRTVPMEECVRRAMRLTPSRLVVGEVRDRSALELLKAWNTGHAGGIATVHANSARMGLVRLEQLAREATDAPQQAYIADTVNVVVFIAYDRTKKSGRVVREIAAVKGWEAGEYKLEAL
jgi:type IV secretion system protein VirB11